MIIDTLVETGIASRVAALRELEALAEKGIRWGIKGAVDAKLTNARDMEAYLQGIRDAISIVECGR